MHDVPQELGGKRVAADQKVFHLPHMERRRAGLCGARNAGHALVGFDLNENRVELVVGVIDLACLRRTHFAKFVVHVDRPCDAFFHEGALDIHDRRELPKPDAGNFHVGSYSLLILGVFAITCNFLGT